MSQMIVAVAAPPNPRLQLTGSLETAAWQVKNQKVQPKKPRNCGETTAIVKNRKAQTPVKMVLGLSVAPPGLEPKATCWGQPRLS
jgi:hypothetical protein